MVQIDYETPQRQPDPRLTLAFVVCCATGALAGAYFGLCFTFNRHPPLDVVAATPFFAVPGLLLGTVLMVFVLRLIHIPAWGRLVLAAVLGLAMAVITTYIFGNVLYSSRLP